eukprot:6487542-Amphidinium_carterae.1
MEGRTHLAMPRRSRHGHCRSLLTPDDVPSTWNALHHMWPRCSRTKRIHSASAEYPSPLSPQRLLPRGAFGPSCMGLSSHHIRGTTMTDHNRVIVAAQPTFRLPLPPCRPPPVDLGVDMFYQRLTMNSSRHICAFTSCSYADHQAEG